MSAPAVNAGAERLAASTPSGAGTDAGGRPAASIYAGVSTLALSVIVLQIALTRVFAIMMWHHLTYLVISIALLGFGAAGSLLTAWGSSAGGRSPARALALWTALYGLSVLGSYALVRRIEVDCFALWSDKGNLLALLAIYALATAPFLLAGLALGMALTRMVGHVDKLYFADLVGSGAGAAASVLLLRAAGGPATVVAAAAIGLVAAYCFARSGSRALRAGALAALAVGGSGLLVVTGAGAGLGLPHWPAHPPFAAGKDFAGYERVPGLDRIWSATAEVEVGPSVPAYPQLGGDIGQSAIAKVESRMLGQDGTAPSFLIKDAGDLGQHAALARVQAASAYVAFAARGGTSPDALVIGVGGGIDVMIALLHGAASVTAVEINTAMIEAVAHRYSDYVGGLFEPAAHDYSHRVRLVASEGRSFVRSSRERYDIIQMSGVDSFTALNTGAYTLSESYLYTTEAVKEFYEHLQPDGYICYSRFLLAYPRQPRETLRLANIAYQALEELGIDNPSAQIAVFHGRIWASTMIKRGAFTRAETEALQQLAREEGYTGLLHDPLRPPGEPARPAADFIDLSKVLDTTLPLLAREQLPGADAASLGEVEAAARQAYAALVSQGRPAADALLESRRSSFAAGQRDALARAAAAILAKLDNMSRPPAAQFAKTADVFRQVLTGSDAERQAFIAGYPYDISACTDDAPFFFNYYRYSGLLDSGATPAAAQSDSKYNPDFPVGHLVLLASLVQIVLLAGLLIFAPLRRLARRGLRPPGTWRYFTYFAALGAGFMFIEIAVMQKTALYLGHPTYALSVVLATLLASAGLGSLLAGRLPAPSRRVLLGLGAAVVLVVAATIWALDHLLPASIGLPLWRRALLVVATLAPLGLVLGMPFPTGMRLVDRQCPPLLPWCWAINGFLSVFSAIFCIVLAMWTGFAAVLATAAVLYAIGFAVMPAARPAGAV